LAPVDRVLLLGHLLVALDAEVAALERGESPLSRFRSHSWLDDRRVEVDTGDGSVVGRVAGIADDGSLLLDADAGRLALSVGEVARVHDAEPAAASR
jgi:biotin-(acetyl-CoA carboxylase) ligase